ncbi:helix-turn-helix transcriptional regulator [Paenibacillus sp. GCM10023248]|uniref:helix-turn-helix transcriptional regulator n=1 Tax=unclassified Paenibacillus TaxID=185978 RepID=UPI00237852D6|nr:AraC family transcriptional regulator [Paenibacillus sp. MAHUQ-63]MDD9269445.1 AraC family transcriptional regulator [Paenibacillus sp. MAHUQ-63]
MEPLTYNLNRLALQIHVVLDKVTYPGWEDMRNLVNVHSLYWIHEGEGTFLTNTEHSVQAGMLAYLKPGLEMSMRSEPHAPLRMTMVLFDCAEIGYDAVWKNVTPVERLGLPFLSQFSPSQSEELGPLFREIHQEWSPGVAAGALVSQAKLQILLHKLHQIEQPDWSLAETGAIAAFEQIKKHLENGYTENQRIERLADAYKISASYLRKLFIKYTGMGPKEYHNHLRNQQACRYLIFTDYPIKEIAKLCGYYEEYHFSKMFKLLNGVSPSSYRTSQRSGE